MTRTAWIDLLDPGEHAIRQVCPDDLHPSALETLVSPLKHTDEPRPRLETHGPSVLGRFVVPIVASEEDRVYYQQIHLLLTHSLLVTVRKTPCEGIPFDSSVVHAACDHEHADSAGMYAFHLVDEVAERYLTLIDDLSSEIDELEEHLEDWSPQRVRQRLSTLRHDLLTVRSAERQGRLQAVFETLAARSCSGSEPALPPEVHELNHCGEDDQRPGPPVTLGPLRLGGTVKVLPVDADDQGWDQEDRRNRREPLHYLVLVVGDLGLAIVTYAGHEVASELYALRRSEQLVVDLAKMDLDRAWKKVLAFNLKAVVDDCAYRITGRRQGSSDLKKRVSAAESLPTSS